MKRGFLALSVLFVVAAVCLGQTAARLATSSNPSPATAEDHYRRGRAMYDLDDREGALAAFSEAIKLDPKHALAYFWRGIAFSWLREEAKSKADHRAALAILDAAIAAKPDDSKNYFQRAYVNRFNDKRAALADLDKAITLDPKYAEAYFERGELFGPYELNDLAKQIADYDLAILHDPDNPRAYQERARARASKKDKEGVVADLNKAIAIYTRTLEQNRRDAVAYRNRGQARNLKVAILKDLAGYQNVPNPKDLENAIVDFSAIIEDFEQALIRNSRFRVAPYQRAMAYVHRAEARFDKGDFIEAFADFDKAIALEGGVTAYSARARARAKREDFAGAIADYDKVIELEADKEHSIFKGMPYQDRGRVLVKQKDYDRAIADFTKALKLSPNDITSHFELADIRIIKGEFEAAEAEYSKAIALKPDAAGAYVRRGLFRLKQNRDTEAEQDFQKSIQLNPKTKEWIEAERNKLRPKPKLPARRAARKRK